MNILYIHQYFKTRDGAGSTRSYEFAKRLIKKGHSVTILTSNISNDRKNKQKLINKYIVDGINVIAIRNKYSNYMNYTRRVISFLRFMIMSSLVSLELKDYDVVFATSTPLTVAIPAIISKKIKKVPFVFEVRDLWPEAPIQMGVIKSPVLIRFLRALERKAYKEAQHVIALSPGMEQGVLSTGVHPNKVSVIPNGCDLDLFSYKNNKVEKKLFKGNKLHNKFVVVHGGSMGVANGLDYIINAAIILKEKDKDIVFLLTGDGKTKPYLEKKCEKYKLENVIFTGSIPRNEMPRILALSDITITSFLNKPILATNSPNKFFDSLAAGKPVIVNSNGWTKDIVEDANVGFYVDPENPDELASLLSELKNQKDLLKKMGTNARLLAEKQFERNKLTNELEKILINAVIKDKQS